MHAPYILSADDLGQFSGIYRKLSILAADDFLGACYRKAMTPQKLWTLLFPHFESGYFLVGWGSSTCSGGGQKVWYVPRNPGNQTFLAGYPGILPGYPGSARKV